MIRPTAIDLNQLELNYNEFLTSLYKCNGSCDVVDDLSTKICVPSKKKYVNMTTGINEGKTLVKHIFCGIKCKFYSTTCNLNNKWNDGKCQCDCQKYHLCKKDNRILAHVFQRIVGS